MHGNIKDLFIYLFYTYTLKSRIKDLEEKNMLTWYIFEKGIKFSWKYCSVWMGTLALDIL